MSRITGPIDMGLTDSKESSLAIIPRPADNCVVLADGSVCAWMDLRARIAGLAMAAGTENLPGRSLRRRRVLRRRASDAAGV